jgi:hypothetical protein
LELSGRQAMLLSRLIDEFPLPQHQQEAPVAGKTPTQTGDSQLKEP